MVKMVDIDLVCSLYLSILDILIYDCMHVIHLLYTRCVVDLCVRHSVVVCGFRQ